MKNETASATASTLPPMAATADTLPPLTSMESLPEFEKAVTHLSLPAIAETVEILPDWDEDAVPHQQLPGWQECLYESEASESCASACQPAACLGPENGSATEPWPRLQQCEERRSNELAPREYDIGHRVRVFSATARGIVDAVVVDQAGTLVKLFFLRGQRGCTKVVPLYDMEKDEADAERSWALRPAPVRFAPGSPVLVRSSTVNVWFKGTVTRCQDQAVEVQFRHNGRLCGKVLARTSPDLRLCHTQPKEKTRTHLVADALGRNIPLKVGLAVSNVDGGGSLATGIVAGI